MTTNLSKEIRCLFAGGGMVESRCLTDGGILSEGVAFVLPSFGSVRFGNQSAITQTASSNRNLKYRRTMSLESKWEGGLKNITIVSTTCPIALNADIKWSNLDRFW